VSREDGGRHEHGVGEAIREGAEPVQRGRRLPGAQETLRRVERRVVGQDEVGGQRLEGDLGDGELTAGQGDVGIPIAGEIGRTCCRARPRVAGDARQETARDDERAEARAPE
jgi:hypothetical protein